MWRECLGRGGVEGRRMEHRDGGLEDALTG